VIILIWMGAMVVLRSADVHTQLATLIDVSGFGEAEHQTKLWTPAEKRESLMELTSPLAWNRISWTLLPLLLLGLALTRLRRETLVLERAKRDLPRSQPNVPSHESDAVVGQVIRPSWLHATFRDACWQAAQLMCGWPFILAMVLWGVINTAAPFAHMTAHAEGPLVPRGQILAPFLLDFNYLFAVFGVAGFVGTLVRRDQQPGFAEIVDATPAPLGVRVLGSALAASLVTLVFVFVPTLSAWIVMALAVPGGFDFWSPLQVNGLVAAPALLELGAITFLIHALVRSSGTAHALSMFAALVAIVNHEITIVSYPLAKVGIPAHVELSEITKFSPWLAAVAALDAFKLSLVVLMFALAWLVYTRGTTTTLALRLRDASRRLRGGAGALAGGALILAIASAWLLRDRLITRGQYRADADRERENAEWEKKFAGRATPLAITGGDVEITIDPGERRARSITHLYGVRSAAGRLNGEVPKGTRSVKARIGAMPGRLTTELDHFELDLTSCPTAGCEVTLELDIAADGWGLQRVPPWLHASGIWARASDLVPRLGLDLERTLRAPELRRAHGLPARPEAPAAAALVTARGVLPAGRFRWRVHVTEPGEQTTPSGETAGPLDFAFAWIPRGRVERSSRQGLALWHGSTRLGVAAEVADDVHAMKRCIFDRIGLPVEVDTVLQAPRGLGGVAAHGRVLWLPEEDGWDVGSRGVGRTKRRAAIGEALAASVLSYAADLRTEPGSRAVTSGIAGFVALSCVRDLDGTDAWLSWITRRSDHVVEELGALDAPVVSLADDGAATWINAYAPLATMAWARAISPGAARESIQAVLERVRHGTPLREALALGFGRDHAGRLLGPPIASDVAVVASSTRLEVRGARSRWADGGWQPAVTALTVAQHFQDGTSRVSGLPVVLDRDTRVTVFDAEPSFERSPLDNVWPRRLPGMNE
jgi:hypothetical protein